jgi:hypothetical protein
MQPTPRTTLAIILGASEFPKSPELGSNVAFLSSALDFKGYLLDPNGFALPEKNLLDLFDSPDPVTEQDEQVRTFLQTRVKELKDLGDLAKDLILYYVGHGAFADPGSQYFLALRDTKENSGSLSGYPIHSLARTLKQNAAQLRRYLILDCCFSAAAYQAFQSGPLEVARQQTQEELPPKGTALLCAAGARVPAKAPPGQRYTMFSGVLLHVLKKGFPDLPDRLSLGEVGRQTQSLIHDRFSDAAVRPEVLSPDQTRGDVADLPIFPNPRLDVTEGFDFEQRVCNRRIWDEELQGPSGGAGTAVKRPQDWAVVLQARPTEAAATAMDLPGWKRKQLCDALRRVFRNQDELTQFLSFRLNVQPAPAPLTSGKVFDTQVFELLSWLEKGQRLGEFVKELQRAWPGDRTFGGASPTGKGQARCGSLHDVPLRRVDKQPRARLAPCILPSLSAPRFARQGYGRPPGSDHSRPPRRN